MHIFHYHHTFPSTPSASASLGMPFCLALHIDWITLGLYVTMTARPNKSWVNCATARAGAILCHLFHNKASTVSRTHRPLGRFILIEPDKYLVYFIFKYNYIVESIVMTKKKNLLYSELIRFKGLRL